MRAFAEVARAEVDVAERLEVDDLARARGPCDCVDVKPRKSSAVSGISSAPGICAAIAIFFGRLWPPPKPPPAKPLRIDVTSNSAAARRTAPGRVGDVVERVAAQQHATSFSSRIAESGSLGKRRAASSASPCARAGRTAACSRHAPGTSRSKYGSPHATVTPSPAGVGSKLALQPGERRPRARAARPRGREASTFTRAVTTSWWSGGTETSTSLSVTVRTPSRTCCSGGNGAAGARSGEAPASRSTSS